MRQHPVTRWFATALAVTALVGGVAACSDDSSDKADDTTTTTAAAGGTTSSSTSTTKVVGTPPPTDHAGCARSDDATVPVGFASRKVADLDGDGQGDTLFVGAGEASKEYGILTASGHRSTWLAPDASGVEPSILGVVDADQDGRQEVFVNPGRHVFVLVLAGCELQPVVNKDGQPYAFSVGFEDTGTGVGCVDANHDGKRDLVGLKGGDPVGGKVAWSRTIVTLQGTQARNGATDNGTYTSPADDAAIALLHKVTCGDDTFADPLTSTG